jgi:predicted RNase H-like HicB family nuclease
MTDFLLAAQPAAGIVTEEAELLAGDPRREASSCRRLHRMDATLGIAGFKPANYGQEVVVRPLKIPVRAVLYREDDKWVAHCLEFDLVGSGDSLEEAFQSLATAIAIQAEEVMESGNAGNLFSPAPGEYFKMYAAGKNVAIGEFRFTSRALKSKK